MATFFALTLALSWALWIPAFALADSTLLAGAAVVLGSWGPAAAAALVTLAVGDSLREWAGRLLRWRVDPRWYLVAIGVPTLAGALVVPLHLATGGSLDLSGVPPAWLLPLAVLFTAVTGGGNEEPGWRGFALPRLQAARGPLSASWAIAAVWALWHLPLYALEGGIYHGGSFLLFSVGVFAFSPVYTWLFNRTGGSVLLPVVLHAVGNNVPGYFQAALVVDGATRPTLYFVVAFWAVTAVLLAATRGRLGYRPGRNPPSGPVDGSAPG